MLIWIVVFIIVVILIVLLLLFLKRRQGEVGEPEDNRTKYIGEQPKMQDNNTQIHPEVPNKTPKQPNKPSEAEVNVDWSFDK